MFTGRDARLFAPLTSTLVSGNVVAGIILNPVAEVLILAFVVTLGHRGQF
jgi:tetrahydromethanopterin S-methyltransferase subunit F